MKHTLYIFCWLLFFNNTIAQKSIGGGIGLGYNAIPRGLYSKIKYISGLPFALNMVGALQKKDLVHTLEISYEANNWHEEIATIDLLGNAIETWDVNKRNFSIAYQTKYFLKHKGKKITRYISGGFAYLIKKRTFNDAFNELVTLKQTFIPNIFPIGYKLQYPKITTYIEAGYGGGGLLRVVFTKNIKR